MDFKELLGVIFAGVSLLILVGCCFFAIVYLAKDEKEHNKLLRKELQARIQFYDDFIKYINK